MKIHPIEPKELWLAQGALALAILLQIIVGMLGPGLAFDPHFLIIGAEIALSTIIGINGHRRHLSGAALHRPLVFVLLGLLSAANIASFIAIAGTLIGGNHALTGLEMLTSALAIFITNIIIFAFWYWEIDSPGLSGHRWSQADMDFLFTQQENSKRFPDWQPAFVDYLYLSLTNAINFAPADTKPITHKSKALMATQALLSVFTLALVLARSVSILGQ